jgi:hypothetical protein
MEWNPLVNTNFSLEGDYGLQDGFVHELQLGGGEKKTLLTNSYVPMEYPSLNLMLDNKILLENERTEFEEFVYWFNITLRYGSLPFSVTKLGNTKEPNETGVYKFIPNSVKYDKIMDTVLVAFGLKEIDVIPEAEYTFLGTNNGQILLTNNSQPIIAY